MFSNALGSYGAGSLGFMSDYHSGPQSADGFTEGGFLAGATQDAGVDGGFINASDSRKRGIAEGQKIHPLKISLVLKSLAENPQEHRIKFFDDEVTVFKLVGLVSNLHVDEDSEKWSFSLHDGTGTIPVEWLAQRLRDYTEVEPSGWMRDELARIRDNVYVRVCGDINLLGKSKPHISAFFVSAIDIPEEIVYHDLQVAQALVSHINPTALPSRDSSAAQTPTSSGAHTFPSHFGGGNNSGLGGLSFGSVAPTGFSTNTVSFYGSTGSHAPPHTPASLTSSTAAVSQLPLYGAAASGLGRLSATPSLASGATDVGKNTSVPNTTPLNVAQPTRVTCPIQSSSGSGSHSVAASTILEILRNMSKLRPEGLSVDDLLTQLVGRGIGANETTVDQECRQLMYEGILARQEETGRWKLTSI